MYAPISRLSFFAAILVLLASIFQKQLAERMGQPMTEPTTWEKVLGGAKEILVVAKGETGIQAPEHPVAKKIFYAGIIIACFALVGWVLEDVFWLPILAMCLALAAVMLKAAWLPALLVALKTAKPAPRRRSTSASRSRKSF